MRRCHVVVLLIESVYLKRFRILAKARRYGLIIVIVISGLMTAVQYTGIVEMAL